MKKVISTPNAPAAIGPYSQAIEANGMLFLSGQIALDPATGQLVDESIEAETQQVLENLGAVLRAANCDYDHVVKCSIFLSSMEHYAAVNLIYAEFFQENAPAREAVAVKTLPKGVNVEISAIAVSRD